MAQIFALSSSSLIIYFKSHLHWSIWLAHPTSRVETYLIS
uniref:Uncharacterized protein n=1 Tax=Lotus japonicus TaxID=34305 RepID=I3T257_LOTJA|nr:unknown [Lotus japonicus]